MIWENKVRLGLLDPENSMAKAQPLPRILLITGIPGIGKTTVVRKVVKRLGKAHVCGFYTEALREPSAS